MADRTLRLRELRNRLIPALKARIESERVKHARSLSLLKEAIKRRQVHINSNTPMSRFLDDAIPVITYMLTTLEQNILRYSEQLTGLYAESHLLVKTSCTSRRVRGE